MKPCPHCHQTFRHGERKACCSGCGQAFLGQSAFDRHQRVVDNSAVCLGPATEVGQDGNRVFKRSGQSPHSKNGMFWSLAPKPGRSNPWANRPDKKEGHDV